MELKSYVIRGTRVTQEELTINELLAAVAVLAELESMDLEDVPGMLRDLGRGDFLPRLFGIILRGVPDGMDLGRVPAGVGMEILRDFFGFNGQAMRSLPGVFSEFVVSGGMGTKPEKGSPNSGTGTLEAGTPTMTGTAGPEA